MSVLDAVNQAIADGRWDRAALLAGGALAQRDLSQRTILRIIEGCGEAGLYSSALPLAERLIRMDPYNPSYWHNFGLVKRKLGDFVGATEAQQTALVADPAHKGAQLELSKIARDMKRAEEMALQAAAGQAQVQQATAHAPVVPVAVRGVLSIIGPLLASVARTVPGPSANDAECVAPPALDAAAPDPATQPIPEGAPASYIVVGLCALAIAGLLFILLCATHNPNLVPAALIAMSAVVPATVMTYVVGKYDQTGISFQTLTITFLLGGSLGLIGATIIGGAVDAAAFAALPPFGALLRLVGGLPLFAGVYEEPAKLFATGWCWKHPTYHRPMDGLIIGLVSGFGFAVFETAGYGFTRLMLMDGGFSGLLELMVRRGVLAPFGHGLWCAIVSAAFWQAGRTVKAASKDRVFMRSLAEVIGLHALWNVGFIGILGPLASAALTIVIFRARLLHQGRGA